MTSADQVINVSLQPGENLDEIIVSASRRAQKVQDAPASVSIVSAKDIENSAVAVDPVRHFSEYSWGSDTTTICQQNKSLKCEEVLESLELGAFPILDYRF